MFTNNCLKVIELLIDAGIEITLVKHEGKIGFDINTEAKSGCVIVVDPHTMLGKCYMRYDDTSNVDFNQSTESVVYDLCWIVKDCMHGRDFVNRKWLELMVKYDVVEIEETIIRKIK